MSIKHLALALAVATATLAGVRSADAYVGTQSCDCPYQYPDHPGVIGYSCSWIHKRCYWQLIPTGPTLPADFGIDVSVPVTVIMSGDWDRCDIAPDGTITTVNVEVSASHTGGASWQVSGSADINLTNAAVSMVMQAIPWVFEWVNPWPWEVSGHYESTVSDTIELKSGTAVQIPACARRGYTAKAYVRKGIKHFVRARGTWVSDLFCTKISSPGAGSTYSEYNKASNTCPVRDYLTVTYSARHMHWSGKEHDLGCPPGSPCLTAPPVDAGYPYPYPYPPPSGGGSGSGSGSGTGSYP